MDEYRAPCRPFSTGCRQCGAPPPKPLRFYCSGECRTRFENDHFWGTASFAATKRQQVYDVETHRYVGVVCARCEALVGGQPCEGPPEVNHIAPVNGNRLHFGCQNHMANLEVVGHRCHVAITKEQRAAGLIGKPKAGRQIALPLVTA